MSVHMPSAEEARTRFIHAKTTASEITAFRVYARNVLRAVEEQIKGYVQGNSDEWDQGLQHAAAVVRDAMADL